MLAAVRLDRELAEPTAGASADVLAVLRSRGGLLPIRAGVGLRPAGDRGRRGAVGPGGPGHRHRRRLLGGPLAPVAVQRRPSSGGRHWLGGRPSASAGAVLGSGVGEGRWSLLPEPDLSGAGPDTGGPASEELAEAVAWQLLARWGVVVWELWARESFRVPWRDVVRALRRLEARGQVLGGRFVAGISGEQYALPEAASLLADVRPRPGSGSRGEVAGADPLNLTGDMVGGARVPAVRYRSVHYRGRPSRAVVPAR